MPLEKLEPYRIRKNDAYASNTGDNFGLFSVPSPIDPRLRLIVLVAPMTESWQHVSVSTQRRCPNWLEMCKVKELVWGDDVTVIQYHPKKSEYINDHPYCLHLWKRRDEDWPLPPKIFIGLGRKEG